MFWILVIGSLTAINCSLIGVFLVLRKASMMGDAISHAVLPGIVLAFLIAGTKSTPGVLLGAGSVGLLAALLMEFLYRKVGLQNDASIGINFTWLFAVGIILISFFSKRVDLDPDCILYGEIAYASLDTWTSPAGVDWGPRSFYILLGMLAVNIFFVATGYKQLTVTTFDPAFAASMGIRTAVWHYLLMALTAFTAVASFEVVGAVLVVALLVAPAAAAYLLTHRLWHMILLATGFGVLSAVGGSLLAQQVNGSVAGAIASVSGILFGVAFLLRSKSVALQS